MYMEDNELLEQLKEERNLSPNSVKAYKNSMNLYTRLNEKSLIELIEEADEEEEQGIRWKRRKIRQRLLSYRKYVYDNYKENTARRYFSLIKTIYLHMDIEIHNLPRISTKRANKSKPLTYEDLPTKQVLKKAINLANPLMRAIITFMCSSGTGRRECLNLQVQQYLNGFKDYINTPVTTENIQLIINEINKLIDDELIIIPKIDLIRQKTGRHYFTFCSTEAVRSINTYLLTRNDLTLTSPVFQINNTYLAYKFLELNDALNLGFINGYGVLRSHTLRKFHASNIILGEDGLSIEQVDSLQGRKKSSVHGSYFFEDYKQFRREYIKAMPNVLINYEVNVLDVESEEYVQLKLEKDSLELENNRIREDIESEVAKQVHKAMRVAWLRTQEEIK